MGKRLEKLGLPQLETIKKRASDAPLAEKPVDLNLRMGYVPPVTPKPEVDFRMPADPKKQVDLLADAIGKATDAATHDRLVRGLRDQIAKILQPFLKPDETKKKIDDAIKSLVPSS